MRANRIIMRELTKIFCSIESLQEGIDQGIRTLSVAHISHQLQQERRLLYKAVLSISYSANLDKLLRQVTHIEQQLSCLGYVLECCVVIDLLRKHLPTLMEYARKHNLIDYDFFRAKFEEFSNQYEVYASSSFRSDSDGPHIYRLRALLDCLGNQVVFIIKTHYQKLIEQWYRDNTSVTHNQFILKIYKKMVVMLTTLDDLTKLLPVSAQILQQMDQFLKKSASDFFAGTRYRLLLSMPAQEQEKNKYDQDTDKLTFS